MKVIGLDTEHSYGYMKPWMNGFYLTNVCFVDNTTNENWVWWFEHDKMPGDAPTPRENIEDMQTKLHSYDLVVAHNLKHDLNILKYYGLDFSGKKLWCTQVADYILNGQDTRGDMRYSLDAVLKRRGLGEKEHKDEVREYWDSGRDTRTIPMMLLNEYVIADTEETLACYNDQIGDMQAQGTEKVIKLQMEFIKVLSDIESNGIAWDNERAKRIIDEYRARLIEVERSLLDTIGDTRINLTSPQQLSAALYGGTIQEEGTEWTIRELKNESLYYERKAKINRDIKGLGFSPLPKTESKIKMGVFKTDKPTIAKLKCHSSDQRKAKAGLIELSEVSKVVASLAGKTANTGLVSKIQPDGLIHTNLNNTVTSTGRLSSSEPNSQNFPRGGTSPIKKCIVSRFPDGRIVQVDLDQIEWRGAAELSKDETMTNEINSGIDQHNATCEDLMELPLNKDNRTHAKIFNFRMIYGGSWYGFYMDNKMPDFGMKKWKGIVDDFYSKYWGLELWQQKNIAIVNRDGKLQIPTGRWFHFHKNSYEDGIMTFNERQVKNYPVQGLAGGDILPLLAVIIRNGLIKYGMETLIILTVHDSIVFDAPLHELPKLKELCIKSCDALPQYIKNWFGFEWKTRLSGEVEAGYNYADMEVV